MSLELKNLSFAYTVDKPVLHNINLKSIKKSELTALIGPNATGKSTFFKCLSGILKAPQSEIKVSDSKMTFEDKKKWNQTICYMPQSFTSNAALTVFDVVLLARKNLLGWKINDADIEIVAETINKLNIDHLSELYIGDLSGGQQQMVSIAQAIVRQPEVFLLDEPTSALDLRHQLEIMSIIKEVTKTRNIISVVALHDLNLAARFADNLILMRDGEIVITGAPDKVLASDQLSETYGVNIEIQKTNNGNTTVSASI